MASEERDSAVKIQSLYRGRKARAEVKDLKARHESATKIQAVHRGRKGRAAAAKKAEHTRAAQEPDLPLQHGADSAAVEEFVEQKGGARPRWYTTEDIAEHATPSSAWVSVFGRVLDISPIIAEWGETYPELVSPLKKFAGTDISHWFHKERRGVRQTVDRHGLSRPYLPHGPFVHAYAAEPGCTYPTAFEGEAWWNDWQYVIGLRSAESRPLVFVNTLSEERNRITAAGEETLDEILEHRVLGFNKHARSYTWKWIGQRGRPLVMAKTLAENLVCNLQPEFTDLCLQEEMAVPVIMLHYNDDLTVA